MTREQKLRKLVESWGYTSRESSINAAYRRGVQKCLSELEATLAESEEGVGAPRAEPGVGLDALIAYVVRRKAEVASEGGIYDNGFMCVDEAGVAFEVDADAFAELAAPASPPPSEPTTEEPRTRCCDAPLAFSEEGPYCSACRTVSPRVLFQTPPSEPTTYACAGCRAIIERNAAGDLMDCPCGHRSMIRSPPSETKEKP